MVNIFYLEIVPTTTGTWGNTSLSLACMVCLRYGSLVCFTRYSRSFEPTEGRAELIGLDQEVQNSS